MPRSVARPSSAVLLALAACGGAPQGSPVDAAPADATVDVGTDAFDPKAAPCATTFGSGMTPGFGRFDGTILAVVPPGDQSCALPNSTHLVVQATIGADAYRLVVDVLSNQGSPDVLLAEHDAPLVGSAWAEGWHTGASLDYVTDLGVHSPAFTATHEADLVHAIRGELDLGAHVSIFATAGATEPNSAHLVHRNVTNADGAIVIHPDSGQPHYILLRFAEQAF